MCQGNSGKEGLSGWMQQVAGDAVERWHENGRHPIGSAFRSGHGHHRRLIHKSAEVGAQQGTWNENMAEAFSGGACLNRTRSVCRDDNGIPPGRDLPHGERAEMTRQEQSHQKGHGSLHARSLAENRGAVNDRVKTPKGPVSTVGDRLKPLWRGQIDSPRACCGSAFLLRILDCLRRHGPATAACPRKAKRS